MVGDVVTCLTGGEGGGGAMEPLCCQGDDSKHQAQQWPQVSRAWGPDLAWTKVTTAAEREPVETGGDLVLFLCQ